MGDITKAKELAKKLRINEEFYVYCSKVSRMMYKEHYTEQIFKEKFDV